MKTKSFADIHCHPTMFPYNQGEATTWHEHHHLLYPSQSDFFKLARGNVRVVFVSLYPIEQGFLTFKPLGLETGDITDTLANIILSIPDSRANTIQHYDHEYMDDLLSEYKFLADHASPETMEVKLTGREKKRFRYKIVSNYEDLKQLLSLDDQYNITLPDNDTIAVVLTLEGGHALGTGQLNTRTLTEAELNVKLKDNIRKLKILGGDSGHCPFFVTLSHHFWNQLGGQAISLYNLMHKIFDQRTGINDDISDLGKMVVGELLSKENGRRILIDTKHMTVKAKEWYYKIFLPDWKNHTGETIPIIASHCGINGIPTIMASAIEGQPDSIHEYADEIYDNSHEYNPWDLNLSDEEIMIIHESGGLIGLNLDQRIIQGKKMLTTVKHLSEEFPEGTYDSLWAEPLITTIIYIARHIFNTKGNESVIWNNITIGSDFDGLITPIKICKNSESCGNAVHETEKPGEHGTIPGE